MSTNPKRLVFRLFSWSRLLLAFGIAALFICVYVSPLMRWSDIRVVLMSTQFTGALLRQDMFFLVAAAIMAVAALAGRWYCSVLCPFGTLQEAVWRTGRIAGRKARYISPWRLRYIVPVLAGIGIVFAVPLLFIPMDPISNFGRGVRSVLTLANEGAASMTPYTWAMFGIFAFILALAAMRGRRFCDWCPAGTLLGAFASVAPLGMRLKKDACVSCGKCEQACPMSCIDAKEKILDDSRCVLCLSCAGNCAFGALKYGSVLPYEKTEKTGRREFFKKSGVILAGAGYLCGVALRQVLPGLARSRNISGPIPFVMPPGARDIDSFMANCIGCKACAAACPVKIIRTDNSPHPKLDFTSHYCQYSCTACSSVCPSPALSRLSVEEKQRTRIGLAALYRENCVAITHGAACGACAEVCAPRALQMEPIDPEWPMGLTAPVLHSEYCIGCGGCYHICPVRWEPRAITFTGVTPHTLTPGKYLSPLQNGGALDFRLPDGGFPF